MWVNDRPQQMTDILRLLKDERQPLKVVYLEENGIKTAMLCTPDKPYNP